MQTAHGIVDLLMAAPNQMHHALMRHLAVTGMIQYHRVDSEVCVELDDDQPETQASLMKEAERQYYTIHREAIRHLFCRQ